MGQLLIERTVRSNFIENLMINLVARYLCINSEKLIHKRGIPIAVFANDWIGTNIFLSGVYEEELIDDLVLVVSKTGLNINEMTIVDVGANIGNHSIRFANKFSKVFSFEPNPRTYEILNSNTRRIDNIFSFNIGLSSEKATLDLKETWANMGGSSAKANLVSNAIVNIEVTTLDELSWSLGKIDVIKIDVEGMELDVLRGSIGVILRNHPIICLEQLETEFLDQFNETASLDMLRELGYRLFAYETFKPSPWWLVRRLKNIKELLFGKITKRAVYEFEKIPKGSHPMIFAIHSTACESLLKHKEVAEKPT